MNAATTTNTPAHASGTDARPISTRGRMGSIANVRIAGTGSYVPPKHVTNEDLAKLGCDSDWIVRRTGIHSRYHALASQATSDLCYEASVIAMKRAGVTADQIDMVLVATITPDNKTPSTACHLQRRLGITAPAMDISAACAGYMYGLVTAGQFISAGNNRCILVVGADLMSRTVDPEDKKTYPLFGDGAGATIVTDDPEGKGEILSYQLGSEGCGGEMLCIPAGGTRMETTPETYREGHQYLKMDGRNVFKWAVRLFDESAKDVLQ
ncbi:MAG: beta-ketoacyl-ACP synthase 3, partial [Planctomycetota bacterium]